MEYDAWVGSQPDLAPFLQGGDTGWQTSPLMETARGLGLREDQDFGSFLQERHSKLFSPDASGRSPWGSTGLGWNQQPTFFNDLAPVNIDGEQWSRVGEDIAAPGFRERLIQNNAKPDNLTHFFDQYDPASVSRYDPEQGYMMKTPQFEELRRAMDSTKSEGVMAYNAPLPEIIKMALMAFGGYMGAGAMGGLEAGASAFPTAAGEIGASASSLGMPFAGSAGSDLTLSGLQQIANPQLGFTQSLAPEFIGAQTPAFVGAGTTGVGVSAGFNSVDELLSSLGEGPQAGAAGGGAASSAGGGATPDASWGGMVSKLGQGVTPSDMARLGLSNFGDIGRLISRIQFPTTSGSFGMNGIPSIVQGAYGLLKDKQNRKKIEEMMRLADPQSQYRPEYAAMLRDLMADPSKITSMPGWKGGMQAVQRSMASQGYQGSGNMMHALQEFGGNEFNREVQRLSTLAGGSPTNAAAIGTQGITDSTNLVGQALSRIAYGLSR